MIERRNPNENYIALSRGINVGGRNKLSMKELRSLFELRDLTCRMSKPISRAEM